MSDADSDERLVDVAAYETGSQPMDATFLLDSVPLLHDHQRISSESSWNADLNTGTLRSLFLIMFRHLVATVKRDGAYSATSGSLDQAPNDRRLHGTESSSSRTWRP